MFVSSTRIDLSIIPSIVIDSINNGTDIRLPIPYPDKQNSITLFKRSYPQDPNLNVYSEKSGRMNIITFRRTIESESEEVHCEWCSTLHDSVSTIGMPIGHNIINTDNGKLLTILTTGYNCNIRCMYANCLKNFDQASIDIANKLLHTLYNGVIDPAPDRTLHENFNGPLRHHEFLEESSNVHYRNNDGAYDLRIVHTRKVHKKISS